MPPEPHETQPSAEIVPRARNAGEIAFWIGPAQRARRGRETQVRLLARNPLRSRACRGPEMQVRLRFRFIRRNPLQRSCASRARNAGEIAFWIWRAQPSAEIARVEGARCR